MQPVPLPPASNMTVRQISAGDTYACVLLNSTADYVYCFGNGDNFPGGISVSNAAEVFPVVLALPSKSIRSISTGTRVLCVVFLDGTFTCMGNDNADGEQGTGDVTAVGRGILPETVGDLQVRAVSASISPRHLRIRICCSVVH